jgi:threonine dehydrogenase-like Zn-dependent dehydrogenase
MRTVLGIVVIVLADGTGTSKVAAIYSIKSRITLAKSVGAHTVVAAITSAVVHI